MKDNIKLPYEQRVCSGVVFFVVRCICRGIDKRLQLTHRNSEKIQGGVVMAQGKKYDDDFKEKVLAEVATTNSLSKVAKKYKLAVSTVKDWRDKLNSPENKEKLQEFEKLRNKKKTEFVEEAWKNIELAQEILSRRLQRAVAHEVTLDIMLEEILKETTGADAKKAIRNKFSAITLEDVGKISTILGTLYDKQALANNEPTERSESKITVEDYLRDCKGAKY